MSGEARTAYEVYQTIEEVIGNYAGRRIQELVRGRDFSDADLHTARGKAQATEEIVKLLRASLGYDHEAL